VPHKVRRNSLRLRQLRDVGRNPPRLGFCGQLGGQSAGKLVFEIDVGELLPAVIAHDEGGGFFLDTRAVPTNPLACSQPTPKANQKIPFCRSLEAHHRTALASLRQARYQFEVQDQSQRDHRLAPRQGNNQCPGGRNSIVVLFLIAWSISSTVRRATILLVTKPLWFATTERAAAEMLSGAS
jgi:hypothetical protein